MPQHVQNAIQSIARNVSRVHFYTLAFAQHAFPTVTHVRPRYFVANVSMVFISEPMVNNVFRVVGTVRSVREQDCVSNAMTDIMLGMMVHAQLVATNVKDATKRESV